MTISDLIKQLQEIKEREGDIQVRVQTLSHTWKPDLEVRKDGETSWLLLNS